MTRQALRPVPDAPPRAVLYLRQSTTREESVSLELQETACRDHCDRHGYQVVAVLADPGISGRTWRRPGVSETLAMVEDGRADVIVLWRWSRLSRSRRDWALAADRVDVAGGRIESATEPADTTTSAGRLTRGMLVELAAWESEVKSEQWKEAQARRLRLGLPHNGGHRPGYSYSRETGYVPDPVEGPLLADLYRRYAAGEGFQKLARWLNDHGHRTSRGSPWTVGSLARQLDSGFAAGLIVTGSATGLRVYHPGAHEPLITVHEWEGYLARRARLARLPARARSPVYPLTGLVRCGCGAALSAIPKGDKPGYLYRCGAYAASRTCPGVWVTRRRVEAAVLEELARWADDVDERAAVATAREAARATTRADRRALRREEQRLAQALARLTVDLASGLVRDSEYVLARDELAARQDEVRARLADLDGDAEHLAGGHVQVARGLLAEWDTMPAPARRDLLASLVRRVVVTRSEPRGVTIRVEPVWEPAR